MMTAQIPGQFIGGSCVHAPSSGMTIATFVFSVVDTDVVRRLIEHMYIELDVCEDPEGNLAYSLAVPDRGLGPWLITLNPDDIGLIEETQNLLNTCPTFIRGERGDIIGLADFAMDLDHDFSGHYAKARLAFNDGSFDEARGLIEPLLSGEPYGLFHARRLLGLCHLGAGRTAEAIDALRASLKVACLTGGNKLHPAASTSLRDLADAYTKIDRLDAAAVCLLHSLQLRPNNPGALLDLASIFSKENDLVEHVLARVLALGEQDDAAAAWAEKAGAGPQLERAKRTSGDIDLSSWPYGDSAFGMRSHLDSALDVPLAPPRAPKPTGPLFGARSRALGGSKVITTSSGDAERRQKSRPLLFAITLGGLLIVIIVYVLYVTASRQRDMAPPVGSRAPAIAPTKQPGRAGPGVMPDHMPARVCSTLISRRG